MTPGQFLALAIGMVVAMVMTEVAMILMLRARIERIRRQEFHRGFAEGRKIDRAQTQEEKSWVSPKFRFTHSDRRNGLS